MAPLRWLMYRNTLTLLILGVVTTYCINGNHDNLALLVTGTTLGFIFILGIILFIIGLADGSYNEKTDTEND